MSPIAFVDATRIELDRIKVSHELNGDAERIAAYYRTWATTYDDDVVKEQYRGPAVIADMLSTLHTTYVTSERKHFRTLDAGCGTGLTGVALHRSGFHYIDGVDLSPEMIARARRTGVYQRLISGVDLNKPIHDIEDGLYEATTSSGVFTLGHVAPAGLWEFVRVTRPGGFVVISTRKSYFEITSFGDEVKHLCDAGRIRLLYCLLDGNYIAEEGAHYWAFEVLGSHR